VDVITNVNADAANVPRNLGVEFNFLVGQELTRD
jgi:hypothetical protein